MSDEEAPPVDEQEIRNALFTPCVTKTDLHDWVDLFLDIDLPDSLVDENSTASCTDVLWEVYDAMRLGNRPDLSRMMSYASRDSFKTLGAAVIEILCICHLGRDVGHMAAEASQSQNSQLYVKQAFARPYLRDFLTSDNDTNVRITRYVDNHGKTISPAEFKDLMPVERTMFRQVTNNIKIVICSPKGTNSLHVPFFVVDEVDLIEEPKQLRAYEESKMVPSPGRNGEMPLTLLTSTRKIAFGKVQAEIDEAPETGLQIRHWNIIDVTKACEPERHRPDLPMITMYSSQDLLRNATEDEFKSFSPELQLKYAPRKAFAGCAKCPLFFACKTRLATHQPSKSKLLKPIAYTIGKFKELSVSMSKAQLLCLKPAETGLIYSNYTPEIHMLTAAQMAEKITGDKYPPEFAKHQLIELMKQRDLQFYAGLDHGHAHNFVVVSGARDGSRMFVFDVQAGAELELEQKITLMNGSVKNWNPRIFGDTEDPSANNFISRAGYRMAKWVKGPGSVLGGIEIVRMKFMPGIGEPKLFLLRGDSGCEYLSLRLSKYHWKMDAAGKPTDIPNEKDDDECDALRYLVMNVFAPRGKIIATKEGDQRLGGEPVVQVQQQPTAQNYLQNFINQALGQSGSDGFGVAPMKAKKGKFIVDF